MDIRKHVRDGDVIGFDDRPVAAAELVAARHAAAPKECPPEPPTKHLIGRRRQVPQAHRDQRVARITSQSKRVAIRIHVPRAIVGHENRNRYIRQIRQENRGACSDHFFGARGFRQRIEGAGQLTNQGALTAAHGTQRRQRMVARGGIEPSTLRFQTTENSELERAALYRSYSY